MYSMRSLRQPERKITFDENEIETHDFGWFVYLLGFGCYFTSSRIASTHIFILFSLVYSLIDFLCNKRWNCIVRAQQKICNIYTHWRTSAHKPNECFIKMDVCHWNEYMSEKYALFISIVCVCVSVCIHNKHAHKHRSKERQTISHTHTHTSAHPFTTVALR